MFIDEAKINVKAGDGGSGSVAFFVLKGSHKKIACGGKGGKGGDIIIKATSSINTLYNFKHKIHFKAQNGESGSSNRRAGRTGADMTIFVPVGTIIKNQNNEVLYDLKEEGDYAVVAKGGIGGRGNASFVSSKLRFPSFAEKGEKVEEIWLNLELRLLADVALVGFPNSGKSTIISKISNAKPKIADYPFTTLTPNLGVVSYKDYDFVVADIPGIIKGAHSGAGLGDKFLRHIMRSVFLVFVLDGQKIVSNNQLASQDFLELRDELKLYDEELFNKNYMVVVNKIDLIKDLNVLNKIKEDLKEVTDREVVFISAKTGENINDFIKIMAESVKLEKQEYLMQNPKSFKEGSLPLKTYLLDMEEELENKIEIIPQNGEFIVKSKKLERMILMTDLQNEEAITYLKNKLKKMGIGDKLKKMGIPEGSTVIIGDLVFELVE